MKVNAPRKRHDIFVNNDDIDRAIRSSSQRRRGSCAVSRAIKRALWGQGLVNSSVRTDEHWIVFTLNNGAGRIRYRYVTPVIVRGYIADFGAGKVIQPFSFRLNRPHLSEAYKPRGVARPRASRPVIPADPKVQAELE